MRRILNFGATTQNAGYGPAKPDLSRGEVVRLRIHEARGDRRESAPVGGADIARESTEKLKTNVRRAGGLMLFNSLANRGFVAPHDHCFGEALTAAPDEI